MEKLQIFIELVRAQLLGSIVAVKNRKCSGCARTARKRFPRQCGMMLSGGENYLVDE
jgi:hypothetical protein